MGHRGDRPRLGRGMVVIDFLSWMVLDHFMSRTAPTPEVRKSPLARCLVSSNVDNEWGRILDNLRKEKKQVRYSALKVRGWGRVSQNSSSDCKVEISMEGREEGLRGALIFSAFRYN